MCGSKWGKIKFDKSNNVKLLGVNMDNDLNVDEHVSKVYLKANRKLSAQTIKISFLRETRYFIESLQIISLSI